MTRVAFTRICEFYAEEDVVYCMEERERDRQTDRQTEKQTERERETERE